MQNEGWKGKRRKLRGLIAVYLFGLGLLAYIVLTLFGAGLLIKNTIDALERRDKQTCFGQLEIEWEASDMPLQRSRGNWISATEGVYCPMANIRCFA